MFVTSDIFDLETIGRWRGFEWKENLICGIGLYGTAWRGCEAAAAFYLEAAKRCSFLPEIKYAGYGRPDLRQTRNIKPTSFERLSLGQLVGAKRAHGVLFRGQRAAAGSAGGVIFFGGIASGRPARIRTLKGPVPVPNYPYALFSGDFLFPWIENHAEKAGELLQLAIDLMDAEYGYYFIRDDFCVPMNYCCGIGVPLDYSRYNDDDNYQASKWSEFHRSGELWTRPWPLFRDLYAINLISDRHTSQPIEGLGYLTDWISSQPGRGELRDVGRGRKLWTLSDIELFNVRPLLDQAGVLHSCRSRVYRDLPPSPTNTHFPALVWARPQRRSDDAQS